MLHNVFIYVRKYYVYMNRYIDRYYRGVKKFCITKILYGFSTSSAIISNPF